MSNSLQSHRLWHTMLPCSSPAPGVFSNSCPLSQGYHPTSSSSVTSFSSCLQSFPASGSFPMNQFFASSGQSIGVQLQHQSYWWICKTDFLQDWLVWRQEEKGMTEDEMVGWHHRLWTLFWVSFGSWWWTGKPSMLQSTELQSQKWPSDWTEINIKKIIKYYKRIKIFIIKNFSRKNNVLSSHWDLE